MTQPLARDLNGNSGQRAFLDRYAISQQQARNISDTLLSTLAGIKDDSPDSQVAAAVVLFRMNVSPVISIHIPFGGDNHTDTLFANETKQTVAAWPASAISGRSSTPPASRIG